MKPKNKTAKTAVIRAFVAGAILAVLGILAVAAVRFVIRNKNREDIWNTPYTFPGVAKVDPSNFAEYAGPGVGKLILPDEKTVQENLVLDAIDCEIWAYQTYDIAVMETYREKLRGAGYRIVQASDGSWVAYRNGVTVYARNVWGQARVSYFAPQTAPKSGCTADQAAEILTMPGHRVDRPEARCANGYSWEKNTPDTAIDPIDITPAGMFEKTGAQLFVAFGAQRYEPYNICARYYVIRGGNAYEWNLYCPFVFGDATGDGKTELCMSGSICAFWDDENSYTLSECFAVYPRTEYGEKAVVYDLQASDDDMYLVWSMVHPVSVLDVRDDGVWVFGSNQRTYSLHVNAGPVRLETERPSRGVSAGADP